MNIRASVNPSSIEHPTGKPFVVIDNPYDEGGYFYLYWLDATPESLRKLADQLENENRIHAARRAEKLRKDKADAYNAAAASGGIVE